MLLWSLQDVELSDVRGNELSHNIKLGDLSACSGVIEEVAKHI